MKKIFRKSMLILSFLGLLMFIAPKHAKAENDEPCQTILICCGIDDCHYCLICSMQDLREAYFVNCNIVLPDD